jgi:tetratricopeptide (TPR) repeat protein
MDRESQRPRDTSSIDVADQESPSSTVQSSSKIEELLRQGEELLRAGRYQQAIHVWTRILFLDRGNPTARDAIDTAKRALAERQRKLDVMVLDAAGELPDGDRRRARRILARVLAADPRHTEGRSLWEKLEAMDLRGDAHSRPLTTDPNGEPSAPLRKKTKRNKTVRRRRSNAAASPLKMAAFLFCALCLLVLGGTYLHLNWDILLSDDPFATSRPGGAEALDEQEVVPIPSTDELRYYNGARLFAKGRYREALVELARVDRKSSVFETARGLMLRIEDRLLRDSINSESVRTESPSSRKGE